jgi:chaperonin GroEL
MTFRPLHDRVVVRLVEAEEKKDRVHDAMHDTKAAAEEGVVPRGGTALLHAKAAVAKLKTNNPDMKAGIKIMQRALEARIRQIGENEGVAGSIVVGKISDHGSPTFGFDAQVEEYGELVRAGTIDPAKVVRTARQDAASVASLLITTETMAAELPKKESAPAMPGSGMAGKDF